eukprot:scpid92505/ scgid10897/ 
MFNMFISVLSFLSPENSQCHTDAAESYILAQSFTYSSRFPESTKKPCLVAVQDARCNASDVCTCTDEQQNDCQQALEIEQCRHCVHWSDTPSTNSLLVHTAICLEVVCLMNQLCTKGTMDFLPFCVNQAWLDVHAIISFSTNSLVSLKSSFETPPEERK